MGATPRVVIIGAGFGGIGMAIGLREDGVDVTVVEQLDGIGGTWRANTYPGAACDVPSHLYSFSFAPFDEPTCTWDVDLTGAGRNTLNWPGLTIEYRHRTRRVDLGDHERIEATRHRPLRVVPDRQGAREDA